MRCCISQSGGNVESTLAWTDGNMEQKPEMGIFPPVGGAVDVRMCSIRARRKERDYNRDFETNSEGIRRRKGSGGTGNDTRKRTSH